MAEAGGAEAVHLILPVGGLGTRLRPLTHAIPKALAPLVGSTLLEHALESTRGLPIADVTIVAPPGPHGDEIEAAARRATDRPVRVPRQHEPLGQAHAVAIAMDGLPNLEGPALILFVDAVHDIDLSSLPARCDGADGLLHVQEIEDPRASGVAVLDDEGRVLRLVEKPRDPPSHDAVIGVYYMRRAQLLQRAVERLLRTGADGMHRGEHYLLDALQSLIEDGRHLVARRVHHWLDCGNPESLLRANRHVLRRLPHRLEPGAIGPGVRIIPPVRVARGANLARCVVGPHVYIGPGASVVDARIGPDVVLRSGAHVRDAVVRRSLIDAGARVSRSTLDGALLGPRSSWSSPAEAPRLGADSRKEGQ